MRHLRLKSSEAQVSFWHREALTCEVHTLQARVGLSLGRTLSRRTAPIVFSLPATSLQESCRRSFNIRSQPTGQILSNTVEEAHLARALLSQCDYRSSGAATCDADFHPVTWKKFPSLDSLSLSTCLCFFKTIFLSGSDSGPLRRGDKWFVFVRSV